MPADANIFSLIRPAAQQPGPLDSYTQGLQIKALMGQNSLQDLQRREAEATLGEKTSVRDFLRGHTGTLEEAIPGITKISPAQGFQFQEMADKRKKADADLQKVDRENFVAFADAARKRLPTVNSPESWAAFRDEQIQLANMFKTPEVRKLAASAAQSMPAQFDPEYVKRSLVKAEELFTPRPVERTDGQKKWFEDTNPFTNPAILAGSSAQMQVTPGERLTDERTRTEGAANRGVTIRGQNLTDTRAKEAADAGRWTNDLDRGLQVNSATGETRPITAGGAPIGRKDKDLTDAQAKALLYSNRMAEAEGVITTLAEKGVNVSTPGSRAGFGIGATLNTMNSADRQKLDQAKRNFINAVLRRESGAVIAQSEFDNAEQQYFPQVGDSKAVREQKAANRKTAISGIQAEVPQTKRPTAPGVDPTKLSDDELKRELGIK